MLHALIVVGVTLLLSAVANAGERVDFLDYFLQGDDTEESWTLGGTDVRPGVDPEGAGARTIVLSKFSDPGCYEVFKITDTQVQIRYEVVRPDEQGRREFWIRRYQEIGGDGKNPGAVWINRFVTPGGEGVLSRFSQDRYVYDEASKSYIIDKNGSAERLENYLSVVWARNDWGGNNKTGFELNPVLRLIAQWQRDGLIFEMYDYARGKGLVAWRWAERLDRLRPMEGDASGRIFHCEEGFVDVADRAGSPPVAFQFNPTSGKRGRQLEVIRFVSHWRKADGEQWYVIYRDSTKEGPLRKKNERLAHDYRLPEWEARPGATIADLPRLFVK